MAAEIIKFELPNDSLTEIQKIVNTIKEGFKEIRQYQYATCTKSGRD